MYLFRTEYYNPISKHSVDFHFFRVFFFSANNEIIWSWANITSAVRLAQNSKADKSFNWHCVLQNSPPKEELAFQNKRIDSFKMISVMVIRVISELIIETERTKQEQCAKTDICFHNFITIVSVLLFFLSQ